MPVLDYDAALLKITCLLWGVQPLVCTADLGIMNAGNDSILAFSLCRGKKAERSCRHSSTTCADALFTCAPTSSGRLVFPFN